MIHLALAAHGYVVASFAESDDAADFCASRGLLHVPFNLANRDGAPAPLVGTVYRA